MKRGAANMTGENSIGTQRNTLAIEADLTKNETDLAARDGVGTLFAAEARKRDRHGARPIDRAIDNGDLDAVLFWAPVSEMWSRDAEPDDVPLIRALSRSKGGLALAIAQAMPLELLREALAEDPRWRGIPPLAAAARIGNIELVSLLLNAGGDGIANQAVEALEGGYGRTALIWATRTGQTACVELLASRMSLSAINFSEDHWPIASRGESDAGVHTALATAARHGRLATLRALTRVPGIDFGPAAPAVNRSGDGARKVAFDQPALPAAIINDHADCVAALLDNAAFLELARAGERAADSEWGLFQLAAGAAAAHAACVLVERGVATNDGRFDRSASSQFLEVARRLACATDKRQSAALELFVAAVGEALDRHGLLPGFCDAPLSRALEAVERRGRPTERLRAFCDARALRKAVGADRPGASGADDENPLTAPSKPTRRV
jgi:hypothetical protein